MEKPKENKLEKLSKYLKQKQDIEVLLLDMLRANDISPKEYADIIDKNKKAYKRFLEDLEDNPIEESQAKLDFEETKE